jgi:hypothetical protein
VPAVSAPVAERSSDGESCTETKTIRLDKPDFDWDGVEQLDRQQYVNLHDRIMRPEEFEKLYSQPQSVDGLLRNLKIIIDADLLTRPDFFDDANVKRVLGATSIRWTSEALGKNAVLRIGTLEFSGKFLPGIQGNARLMQEREPDKSIFYVGAIDLELPDDSMLVQAITKVFGPPLSAFPITLGASTPDFKGVVSYNYSKDIFESAYLAVNKLDLNIRRVLPERRPLSWTPRTAKGRQRFLCDDDQVQTLSIMQQGR